MSDRIIEHKNLISEHLFSVLHFCNNACFLPVASTIACWLHYIKFSIYAL